MSGVSASEAINATGSDDQRGDAHDQDRPGIERPPTGRETHL